MKNTILILAALLGAMLWTACQNIEAEIIEELPDVEVVEGGYTLTVEASKGIGTKALSLDDTKLNAYWVDNEQVSVFLGGTNLGMLTATADGTDNTKATLAGTLDSVAGVEENGVLTLLYPRAQWDYTGQNGAAPSPDGNLATKYDYATASVTVASVNDGNRTITTTSGANFANQQSMYRFGFKVGGEGAQIAIKGFTVSSTNNALVRTRTWGGSDWTDVPGSLSVEVAGGTLTLPYASLRNTRVGSGNGDTYSFSVIGDDDALYLGSKDIPSSVMDTQGKFISAQSISVTKSNLAKSGTTPELW